MRLCDILSETRIVVDPQGQCVRDKRQALHQLAGLLSPALDVPSDTVERLLEEREALQSTGIGDGVAIPHTSIESVTQQTAALLLCPRGVPFEAIDGEDACIIFGVVGPKKATSEHLKILARISRLLRSPETRRSLLESAGAAQAFSLIEERDKSLG